MLNLWERLAGELIDIVEWTDDSPDTLVWRFERFRNEIKYGARLTVREGQAAVFVNEGRIADVFAPGMYTLETQNLPILSTLQGWKHGFESPFKAEVYFCSMRRFMDMKWGTRAPIMVRDKDFGMVRLRGFGTYGLRIKDPAVVVREIVGTDGHFTTTEISEQLRNLLVAAFSQGVSDTGRSALDLSHHYDDVGKAMEAAVLREIESYGLELLALRVENISVPEEVEKAIDRRSGMEALAGNTPSSIDRFRQFQAAEALTKAAENPGPAGGSMGMGLGMVMAGQVAQPAMTQAAASPGPWGAAAVTPPPLPSEPQWFVAVNGAQTGPFPMGQLGGEVAGGRLRQDSLVWSAGMPNWAAAGEVPSLRPLFANLPPPIPRS